MLVSVTAITKLVHCRLPVQITEGDPALSRVIDLITEGLPNSHSPGLVEAVGNDRV